MIKKLIGINKRKRDQEGFTLLEYCAGAAIILSIIWIGLNTLGGSMQNMLNNIAGWLDRRGNTVNNN